MLGGLPTLPGLPGRARVVIIGGGVIGASVAYHLTALGWTDVLLLEQGQLSCGTTWHAAGLVGQLRASEAGTRLVQYSTRLYERLEAETGQATGFRRCGGVTVARTADRMTALRRTEATGQAFGIDCELLSARAAAERYPLLRTDDLVGALWLPGDGRADPVDLTAALARGARQRGATIRERVRVTGITSKDGRVTGVRTDAGRRRSRGRGELRRAVGQAGRRAGRGDRAAALGRALLRGDRADRRRAPGLPVLRDPDGYTYFKEEVGGLVVGGFEPQAKPWVSPEELPYPFEFQLLAEDWEHFSLLMDSAVHRLPVLAETGIRKFYNGPESFTPDNQFILGEAPELAGFFVAAGFNSVGIASAGGAAWPSRSGSPTVSRTPTSPPWTSAGSPPSTATAGGCGTGSARCSACTTRSRGRTASWKPPGRSGARPVYPLLARAGACFGSKMGWERPNFFAPPGEPAVIEYSWGQQNWQPWSSAEQLATRQRVAVFDQTSFSKYLVAGPDAEAALQWLCTNDVAVEPGRTVYTGMLNDRGTYESDITVTRLSATEYLLVASAATTERDADHIRRRMPPGRQATLTDVTSGYAVYGVMGPAARDLLGRLTRACLDDASFPFGTSKLIDLGYATVRATRITYVGELGWELYVPAEFAVGVYQDLMSAGADLGVANAGYYAIESLRLEKAYRAFGRELTPDYNPAEAGLLFACKLGGSTGFLGREAVEKAKADGPRRRLVSVVLADPGAMLWGGELLAPRRRGGRPADLGRVRGDPRRRRRAGLPARSGRRPGDRRIRQGRQL